MDKEYKIGDTIKCVNTYKPNYSGNQYIAGKEYKIGDIWNENEETPVICVRGENCVGTIPLHINGIYNEENWILYNMEYLFGYNSLGK